MPVKTIIDQKAMVIIHSVTGELTSEDFKSAFDAVPTHPDFQKNMPVASHNIQCTRIAGDTI